MKTLELSPDQIITLNDYPVYSDNVLSEYFSKCKLGREVPFVPVIRKDIVREQLNDELLKELGKFETVTTHLREHFFSLTRFSPFVHFKH